MRFSLLSQLLLGLTASVAVQGAPGSSLALRDGLVARGMPYLNLRNLGGPKNDNSSNDNQDKQDKKDQDIANKGNESNKDIGKNNDNKNKNDNKNNNNNDKDVIVKVVEVAETIQKDGKQITFVEKVTQIIVKNKNNNKKKDRKRKNAMKKAMKNKNMQDKTVVIQVVQIIIDVQDGGKKRYAQSQQTVNKGANETVTAQMTDANVMTIGAGDCGNQDATATAAGAAASEAVVADGTASAVAMAMATDSAAMSEVDASKAVMIMPESAGAPEPAKDVMVMDDPAADLAADDVSQCGV